MHSRIIAERDQAAQAKIVTACQSIAERIGLDAELIARLGKKERDPELTSLFQREAVAEVLGIVAGSMEVAQDDLSESGDNDAEKAGSESDQAEREELEPLNEDTSGDPNGTEAEEPLTLEAESDEKPTARNKTGRRH